MNRAAASAIAFAVGFGGASIVFMAGGDGGDDDPQLLGPLDLFDYCEQVYGTSSTAVLLGDTSYTWRCSYRPSGVFTTVEVEFDEACELQYGENAVAHTWDENVTSSWECRMS